MVSSKLQVMVSQIPILNLAHNRAMVMGTMSRNMITKHKPSRSMASNISLLPLSQDFIPSKEAQHLRLAMPNSLLTANLLRTLEHLSPMVHQG